MKMALIFGAGGLVALAGLFTSLRDDVAKLETSKATRQRLLSEADPILERAERETLGTVRFAGTDYPLVDFQRHLDWKRCWTRSIAGAVNAIRAGKSCVITTLTA